MFASVDYQTTLHFWIFVCYLPTFALEVIMHLLEKLLVVILKMHQASYLSIFVGIWNQPSLHLTCSQFIYNVALRINISDNFFFIIYAFSNEELLFFSSLMMWHQFWTINLNTVVIVSYISNCIPSVSMQNWWWFQVVSNHGLFSITLLFIVCIDQCISCHILCWHWSCQLDVS